MHLQERVSRRFHRVSGRVVFIVALCVSLACLNATASFGQVRANRGNFILGTPAQPYPANPGVTPLHHPALPTGQLAQFRRLAGEDAARLQPIQWKLPEGVVASVAQEGAFTPDPDGKNAFALEVGSVYRFKLDGISTYPGQALYPTLELIGRLNPPAGREWDFPIEIEVPMRDLAISLRGAMVTRVIFVENPENPMNVDASESNDNLTFDLLPGLDPLVAARTRGRALAILRIGTREPSEEPNAANPFFFGLPRVEFRPNAVAENPTDAAIESTTESELSALPESENQPRFVAPKLEETDVEVPQVEAETPDVE